MSTVEVDGSKVEEFVGQVVVEGGAAISFLLAHVGDELGLYRLMSEAGPLRAAELAERTGTNERLVREWLANQAAGGYVIYDAQSATFQLPPEHAMALAADQGPAAMGGLFELTVAAYRDVDKILAAFRNERNLGWSDHHPDLFRAVERLTRPEYETYLTGEWIPALDGVVEKLRVGAKVADVGCGRGASTVIMAKAYPNSEFFGFDTHGNSIEEARKLASEEGVAQRVRFEAAEATTFPDDGYDLVCYLDALHDMGDPLGAIRHARSVVSSVGTVIVVELFAGDRLEENLTPFGRLAFALSTAICVPSAVAQGGAALGSQAGEARLHALFKEAGFRRFRRAAETPFNLVFEARP